MERVLHHKAAVITGANIEEFITPDTTDDLRRMIQDAVEADQVLGKNEESSDNSGSDEVLLGGENEGSDPNVVSMRSSEQSFPVLEVKLDDTGEDVSDSSGGNRVNKKPKHLGTESSGDGSPPAKRAKQSRMWMMSRVQQ
jgi:hypothetical protein